MKNYLLMILFLLPSLSFPAEPANSTIAFHGVKLSDLARIVYGDLLKLSYTFDSEIIHSELDVSINWLDLSNPNIRNLTDDIFKKNGFSLLQIGKVLHITKPEKPHEEFLIYSVKFRATSYLSDILAKVIGLQPLGARVISAGGSFAKATPVGQKEVVGSANSMVDKTSPDMLAYSCIPAQCSKILNLLSQIDTAEPQIILRAAIYEVGLSHSDGSALQVAGQLLNPSNSDSASFAAGNVLTGNAAFKLSVAGFDAALQLLDQDARFNSISRPMVRVKTGGTAKFSVGQNVPILGAVSYSNTGQPIQSVEYKQSGTIFTVTPDVRQDVIDLNVTQEISSFVATTTGVNNSPTMLQRSATSQLSIRSGEVVVFAGLEDQREDSADSSLFGFKIGKKSSRSKSEVLVFIEAQRI